MKTICKLSENMSVKSQKSKQRIVEVKKLLIDLIKIESLQSVYLIPPTYELGTF